MLLLHKKSASLRSAQGTTGAVGNVAATDEDFPSATPCGANCGLKYSIGNYNSETGNVCAAEDLFCVDENTGALTQNIAGNFEEQGVCEGSNCVPNPNNGFYSIELTVADNSGSGATDTEIVQIEVTDVADCGLTNIYDASTAAANFLTSGGQTIYFYGGDLAHSAGE